MVVTVSFRKWSAVASETVLVLLFAGGAIGMIEVARSLYYYYKSRQVRAVNVKPAIDHYGDRASRCRILIVGDSRIRDWRERSLQTHRVTTISLPGSGVSRVAHLAAAALSQSGADVLVVHAGINDISAATMLGRKQALRVVGEAVHSLGPLVDTAANSGAAVVLTTSGGGPRLPPWKQIIARSSGQELSRRFDTEVRRLAGRSDLRLVDVTSLLVELERSSVVFRVDGVHWTPAVYPAIGHAVGRAVELAVPQCRPL